MKWRFSPQASTRRVRGEHVQGTFPRIWPPRRDDVANNQQALSKHTHTTSRRDRIPHSLRFLQQPHSLRFLQQHPAGLDPYPLLHHLYSISHHPYTPTVSRELLPSLPPPSRSYPPLPSSAHSSTSPPFVLSRLLYRSQQPSDLSPPQASTPTH